MTSSAESESARQAWQYKLLPLMSAIIVFAALFFAAMSIFELRELYRKIEHQPLNLENKIASFETAAGREVVNNVEHIRFKVLAVLEADALQRRYHQANSTMLARVWTRQLGFITGMLLAVVGAVFILGQLREAGTRIDAEAEGLKAALETSSPGLVLAVLGSVLMGLTIWIPFGVETRDVSIYLTDSANRRPMLTPDEIKKRENDLFNGASTKFGSGSRGGATVPNKPKQEEAQ